MSILSSMRLLATRSAPSPAPSSGSRASSHGSQAPASEHGRSPSPEPSLAPRGTVRQREDDSDSVADTRELKRLKLASAKVLSNLELSPDLLDEFCTLDIKEMLVNIMAHILSANSEKVRNEFELRMESDAFAASLTIRLVAALVSPNISAYVTEAADHVMSFIKANLDIFKIPREILDDPDLWKTLISVVTALLTKLRGIMKTKLNLAVDNRLPISALVNSLVHRVPVDVDMATWARWAFVRAHIDAFNGLTKRRAGQVSEALDKTSEAAHESRSPSPEDPPPPSSATTVAEAESSRVPSAFAGLQAIAGPGAVPPVPPVAPPAPLELGANPLDLHKHYTNNDFWTFVDDCLEYLRNSCWQLAGDDAKEFKRLWDREFNEVLEYDFRHYPLPKHQAMPGPIHAEWQREINSRLQWL